MAEPIDAVIARVSHVYGRWTRETPVETMRADWDRLFWSEAAAAGIVSSEVSAGGVPATWIAADGASPDRVFVYLHGGGYRVGSVRSHFDLIARLSRASGATGIGIDYRRAPEHRFPAPIEDLRAVYAWLLDQGLAAGRIGLVGDSAGGNLALAGLIDLRDAGLALPSCAVLISPWTDLQARGESYQTRAGSDPIHQRRMILAMARGYLGEADPADPLASPLDADLSGLPPMLIQVGDRETVLDDSRSLAARIEQAGGSATLQVWDGMIHVFQQFPNELIEARRAIADIGAFLAHRLGAAA